MNDVHDEEVAGLPDTVPLDQHAQVEGVAWGHLDSAVVVDDAFDAFVAPDRGGGGRGEAEVEDGGGGCAFSGAIAGTGEQVGEELEGLGFAVQADAEGVLPDDVVGVRGRDFLGVEVVPAFVFPGEDGPDGGFVGGLLRVGSGE